MIDTTVYLYKILVPVAEAYRSEFPKDRRSFDAIRNPVSCRVKFSNKVYEAGWQKFCQDNGLKNDTNLKY